VVQHCDYVVTEVITATHATMVEPLRLFWWICGALRTAIPSPPAV